MTLLNAFTLTTFETDNKLSPTVHRRLKLVAKIDEQISFLFENDGVLNTAMICRLLQTITNFRA